MKGTDDKSTGLFEKIIDDDIPFGISVLTYQEVLQGARDEDEANQLHEYLGTQEIFFLPNSLDFYNQASALRQRLRCKGITIRNTVDILIAMTAIHHDMQLLHNDRDFDFISANIPELKIFG